MKMTKEVMLDFFNALSMVSNLTGTNFSYAVARNTGRLRNEVKALARAGAPDEDFIEYDKKRAALARSFCVMVDGKPKTKVVEGQETFVIKDEDKFRVSFEKLKLENKAVLDKRTKKNNELKALLAEEIDLPIHMVAKGLVPESISGDQMIGIILMIKE